MRALGRREKERGGNNVPAPPPTAWICHKRLGRERGRSREREREEGEMHRDEEGEEEESVCVCVSFY